MLQIEIWNGFEQTFGALGHPAQLLHIPGRVHADAGLHVLAFSLNGMRRMPLPTGPTAFRLLDSGDFNLVLHRNQLKPGENTIRFIAYDKTGQETDVSVRVQLVMGRRWPLPFEADWKRWQRITDIAEVIDGHWQLDGEGVRTKQVGYDRLLAIGDVNWTDYDVTVPMTIHSIDESAAARMWPSMGRLIGVQMRFQGHSHWGDILPPRGWEPLGAIAAFSHDSVNDPASQFRLRLLGGYKDHLLAKQESPQSLHVGERRTLRCCVRTLPSGASRFQAKVWRSDESEPADWQLSAERQQGVLKSGSLLLMAHHVDVTFGKVVVAPTAS